MSVVARRYGQWVKAVVVLATPVRTRSVLLPSVSRERAAKQPAATCTHSGGGAQPLRSILLAALRHLACPQLPAIAPAKL